MTCCTHIFTGIRHVPRHLRLPLALGLALCGIAATALAGDDISKINGSIEAPASSVRGKLETVNGGIRIGGHASVKDVETVNGGITVGDHAETGDLETVNGSIRIGRAAAIDGGVQTVNGSIFADRGTRINGGVETVNGAIGLVASQIGEDVETVNGDITVGIGSRVGGSVHVIRPKLNLTLRTARKPKIIIGPHAIVEGSLVFDRDVDLYVHDTAHVGEIRGTTAIPYSSDTAP